MSYVLTTRNANGFLRASCEFSWDSLTVEEERSQILAHARYYANKFRRAIKVVDLSDVPLPEDFDYEEAATCTICDGYGHGYPGSSKPCPLEVNEQQRAETDYEEAMHSALFDPEESPYDDSAYEVIQFEN